MLRILKIFPFIFHISLYQLRWAFGFIFKFDRYHWHHNQIYLYFRLHRLLYVFGDPSHDKIRLIVSPFLTRQPYYYIHGFITWLMVVPVGRQTGQCYKSPSRHYIFMRNSLYSNISYWDWGAAGQFGSLLLWFSLEVLTTWHEVFGAQRLGDSEAAAISLWLLPKKLLDIFFVSGSRVFRFRSCPRCMDGLGVGTTPLAHASASVSELNKSCFKDLSSVPARSAISRIDIGAIEDFLLS